MERPFKGFSALETSKQFAQWMPAIATAGITTLFGQMYLRPFNNDFRVSLGVVAFAILLLMYEKHWRNVILTALTVGLFRTLLSVSIGWDWSHSLSNHLPAVAYYIIYGGLFYAMNLREKLESPILVATLLMGIDMFSNLTELMFRGNNPMYDMGVQLASISSYAMFRSFLCLVIYFVIRFYPELLYRQKQKRFYYQMVIDHGRLSNEVVFLKKSEQEIENAMSEAFEIYGFLKETECDNENMSQYKGKALDLSRGIHDIKKDYRRIRTGLESMIPEMEPLEITEMKELFNVLCEDLESLARKQSKEISIKFKGQLELSTNKVYAIIGILSNLIVNGIEAMHKSGQIIVEAERVKSHIRIWVIDNGDGIDAENLPHIFNPGFSTKYDVQTGKMNTGMGLSQVKFLAENQLEGSVEVKTRRGKGTRFVVSFEDALVSESDSVENIM